MESITFRNGVENLDPSLTYENPRDAMCRSRDMSLHILLRNMNGAFPGLQNVIRETAESSFYKKESMNVLEMGSGVPFKTLWFQEGFIRQNGDMMIYGSKGSHEPPKVVSTIVSDQDYVLGITSSAYGLDSNTERDYLHDHLEGMFGSPNYKSGNRRVDGLFKLNIADAYHKKQKDGEIKLHIGSNLVKELQAAYAGGERFDIAFPDIAGTTDRMNMLQVVQASLKNGGHAFIPLNWWKPNSFDTSDGLREFDLIKDVVNIGGDFQPLEDYLTDRFPEAYQIAHYPGAKTLILKGTPKPIQLPDFKGKAIGTSQKPVKRVDIEWTPVK